jgi:hypothetical protein
MNELSFLGNKKAVFNKSAFLFIYPDLSRLRKLSSFRDDLRKPVSSYFKPEGRKLTLLLLPPVNSPDSPKPGENLKIVKKRMNVLNVHPFLFGRITLRL